MNLKRTSVEDTALRLAVIADDLTGAADTGVQFRKWGLTVEVLIGLDALRDAFRRADIVVVDTECRADLTEEVYRKVKEAAERLVSLGAEQIYTKIDSTVRGNIGTQIEAVMDAVDAEMAFIAPAYPANGRTTVDGYQMIHGTPVDETEYAEEMAIKEGHVPTLIRLQSRRNIDQIGLETVRRGLGALNRQVGALRDEGVEVIVFDAVSERDLAVIAGGARNIRTISGSAGLASELPLGLGLRSVKPVLSICGSTRSQARLQADALVERLGCSTVEVYALKVVEGGAPYKDEVERCIREVSGALRAGMDVLVTSAPEEDSAERAISLGRSLGLGEDEVRSRIEGALATIASAALEEVAVSGLILTGGSTALMICKALEVERVEILEEVQPGIPLLSLTGGLRAVTKAGGFGGEDALVEAVKYLRRVSPT